MSGWVGRDQSNLTEEGKDEIELLQERRGRKYKVFNGREEAVMYLRFSEHYTVDDLKHMYWIDQSDEELRNLYTGEYSIGFRKIGDSIIAMNFWKCDDCGQIYRTADVPTCPVCGSEYRFNVLAQELKPLAKVLMTNRERIEYSELKLHV